MRKLWLLLAVPIAALDQWVKWWVKWWPLEYLHGRSFFPGIGLTYVENTGAAFSMLDGGAARWFLVVVSTLAAAAIILAVCKKWVAHLFGVISLSCVLGGAVGNLVDRAAQGYVIDMFAFTFINFAIFNVADIFISIGGACFCLHILLEMRKKGPDAGVDENG